MKTWYQVWLPPRGDRLKPKVFGMRANNLMIDMAPTDYSGIKGRDTGTIIKLYEERGAIISKIAEVCI